ncbi:MAG: ThuA domain-containing protein [Polaribacter sp.]|nr:ThuA domain-containing protein [Polaribacter sp.]
MKIYSILLVFFLSSSIFCQVKEFDPYVSVYKMRSDEGRKKILYIGGGDYHDDLRKAAILRKLLEVDNNYYVSYTEDYDVFTRSIKEYDLILINTKINRLTNKQYKGLLKAIKKGLPVLGIHAASASFRRTSKVERPEFYNMLGGKFDHHPKMHTFQIELEENNGILDESFANYDLHDELYFYSNYNTSNKVLLKASYKGKYSPMAWVKKYGKGKVFFTALGHSPAVTKDKNFQKLILFAVNWLLDTSIKFTQ